MKGMQLRILLAVALPLMCSLFGSGFIGCNGATSSDAGINKPGNEAFIEKDFKIRYGQELTVKGQDLKVKFVSVLDDSRCPADVTCVWEGDAKIVIAVRLANSDESQMELHTNQRFTQEAKYKQYVIRLVGLHPHPRTDVERKPSDYIATLTIKKE